MNPSTLPSPQRKVVLRLPGGEENASAAALPTLEVESLLRQAQALGLPLHHDPQIAALLVSLRMSGNVPPPLYAAAATVLATIYDAAHRR